jgi:hypothetical protein
MLEKDVEQHFRFVVAQLGGKTYKFKSPSQTGVADRIACLPDGSTWFVETKRPKGGQLLKPQKIFATEMDELNQKYACLASIEEINNWREKCLKF